MKTQSSQKPVVTTMTAESSKTFIKNNVRIGISTICYARKILPNSCFKINEYCGTSVYTISKQHNDMASALVDWIELGLLDAIKREYLSKVEFSIVNNLDSSVLESYEFSIDYNAISVEEEKNEQGNDKSGNSEQGNENEMANAKVASVLMVRSLTAVSQSLLDIPQNYGITMKIFYTEWTPDSYMTPMFTSEEGTVSNIINTNNDSNEWIPLGKIETRFHQMSTKLITPKLEVNNAEEEPSRTKDKNYCLESLIDSYEPVGNLQTPSNLLSSIDIGCEGIILWMSQTNSLVTRNDIGEKFPYIIPRDILKMIKILISQQKIRILSNGSYELINSIDVHSNKNGIKKNIETQTTEEDVQVWILSHGQPVVAKARAAFPNVSTTIIADAFKSLVEQKLIKKVKNRYFRVDSVGTEDVERIGIIVNDKQNGAMPLNGDNRKLESHSKNEKYGNTIVSISQRNHGSGCHKKRNRMESEHIIPTTIESNNINNSKKQKIHITSSVIKQREVSKQYNTERRVDISSKIIQQQK